MKMISKSVPKIWSFEKGSGPLLATAIHDGHKIRPDLEDIIFVSNKNRLREEDPFTGEWTGVANNRIVGLNSRFQVDLNRPKEKAVYIAPEDAWGMTVWKEMPTEEQIAASIAEYDAFYGEMHKLLTELQNNFGKFVVFDLHSYNHLRGGPEGEPADPEGNPEVNIGTGTLDRDLWAPVIDSFIKSLRDFNYFGRHLDVRENIKFRGGQFPRWINQNFPETGCAIAIEFKKFFMNEWTGEPDREQINMIKKALKSTVPGVLNALKQM